MSVDLVNQALEAAAKEVEAYLHIPSHPCTCRDCLMLRAIAASIRARKTP